MANDQRFPVSLGGVPALVVSSDDRFGQHTIVHEYPGRAPSIDQNGPMPQRFSQEFLFIGPTYQQDLQAFEDVLARTDAQRFVHHWRGSFLVKPEGEYTVRWSTDEGGMCRLTVTLVVAGDEDVPSVRVETFDLVITEGDVAQARMADMVADGFTVEGSNSLRERSTTILEDIVAAVTDANNYTQSQFQSVNTTTSDIVNFGNQLETLVNTPHTMATTIARLVDGTFAAITGVVDSVGDIDPLGDVDQVLGALRRGRQLLVALGILRGGSAFGSGYSTPAQNTPQQRQRAANQRLLVQATRISFLISATRTVARVGVESSTMAETVFTLVNDAVVSLRADVDDNTYRSLANLRAAIGAHMRVAAADLPATTSYTPNGTVPALLLAHTLYGDATREAEIVERNGIAHPGFVRGGGPLEVLSA